MYLTTNYQVTEKAKPQLHRMESKACVSILTLGFPPSIMSVPLPAIFVDIVMAYFRPA